MVVFDLREEATRPFRERGATVADSAAELARRSDVIITALPMPDDVEQVVRGAKGILEGIRAQSIYIDISTNPPSLMRRARTAVSRQRRVSSSTPRWPPASPAPRAASTKIMVGGDKEIFARAEPVLDAFGDQVLHAGPLGSGSICKLVHQMINSTISQAIAEGLTLGVKAGVETMALWECRSPRHGRTHARAARAGAADRLSQRLRDRHVPAQTVAQRRRPWRPRSGASSAVPLPLANIAEQKLVAAVNRGWGDKSAYTVDFSACRRKRRKVELRAEGWTGSSREIYFNESGLTVQTFNASIRSKRFEFRQRL